MEGQRGRIEPAVGGRVKLCIGEEERDLVRSNLCLGARVGGLARNKRLRGRRCARLQDERARWRGEETR